MGIVWYTHTESDFQIFREKNNFKHGWLVVMKGIPSNSSGAVPPSSCRNSDMKGTRENFLWSLIALW